MRKLVALSLVAVTMMVAGTAQANTNSSKAIQVKLQQKKYYHALGYYKAIWHVARRTVYSPNPEIRAKWQGAVKYLKRRMVNSQNEIHRLTAPPAPRVPSGYPPHYQSWLCIHRYEGSWTDSGSPFWGGLQMNWDFMVAYGSDLLNSKGTADHWTPLEQMWVAEKAWKSRGFWPWPNTARYCGLL